MRTREILEKLIENWPAKVLSLAAAVVLFLFFRTVTLEERFFNVPLELSVPENYLPASPIPERVRVTLRGGEEEIFQVMEEDIQAHADFSRFTGEGVYKASIRITRQGSALVVDPLEIEVMPTEITVTLERKLIKNLDVYPVISGYPAQGYELSQYFITPSTVEVEGPESHVGGMERILTEEIDLSGKQESFTTRVRLKIDDQFIEVPGGEYVEFHGIIQEKIILETFEAVEIITIDLEPEFSIRNDLPRGSIQVQGNQNLLVGVDPGGIRLLADCSRVTAAGNYVIPVKPDVPLGLLVLNYEPQQVRLEVFEE